MTLIELLNQYSVKVPIIQRDYVQGRDNIQTKFIRETLLNDMKNAIEKNTPMDLNFIYGKTIGNEFIPIDGQQRLTTLFLLHLYAFRNDASKTELFKNFTYATRTSSREFIEEIVKKRDKIFNITEEFPKPSDLITDSTDYVSSYNYDPTVQSMLVILDEIAELFEGVNNLDNTLLETSNPPISFNFLDINNLGSEDNLYIKLNARGKPLTDFENFKARLLGRLKALSGNLPFEVNDFESAFDGKWTDIFWKREKDKYEKEYYTFFRILLFNSGLIRVNDVNWVQTLDYGEIPREVFIAAFNLLNYLCNKPDPDVDKNIFMVLDSPIASNLVIFHFISVFLRERSDLVNSKEMKDWVRVFENLVGNSVIDDYQAALNSIKAIDNFAATPNNLTDILSNIGALKFGFNGDQLKEETEKAAIILAERKSNAAAPGSFEMAIYQAEKFPFFKGQIRAALNLAKDNTNPFKYDLNKFIDYWHAIEKLFVVNDKSKKLQYGALLRRALLSMGDYPLTIAGSYKTLCSDNTDSRGCFSIRRLFSDCPEIKFKDFDGNPVGCNRITKDLLDRIILQPNADVRTVLEGIINGNIANLKQTDWRYCLVKYDQLFEFVSSYVSPSYYRIRKTSKNVLVVRKQNSSGYNIELFTLALMYELNARSMPTKLYVDKNRNDIGQTTNGYYCIVFNGSKGRYFIQYDVNSFVISNTAAKGIFRSKTTDQITETADYIENNLK